MVSDGGMRASDSDREKVVELLGAAYTEGRLGLDEFDDRTTAAYAAKTWDELRQLTSDLPAGASLDGPSATASPDGPQLSLPPAGPRAPGREIMFVPFLPVAIVLLILAVSAHAALLFVPMLIVLFALRAARRSHGGSRGPGGGPGGSFPPGPGGHVPPRTGGDPL
ncbi:MAG TPA: DUF1707 domain-containing protein [Streptosporangiaceae bacterium]|nr:DUF1707 domain-containing protein [Streptosporangiaceae bacterium]